MHTQEQLAGESQKGGEGPIWIGKNPTVRDLCSNRTLRNICTTDYKRCYLLRASECGFPHY